MSSKRDLGSVYDLQSLFDRLNRIYFDGRLKSKVEWARRQAPKAKRSVVLGEYFKEKDLIRMSRRLDNPRVPLFFVEHILFHEMLHAVFPRDPHRMHTPKFRHYEKMQPDYERAKEWEKKNIKILFEASQLGLFSSGTPVEDRPVSAKL
jgi:hypothetical protein